MARTEIYAHRVPVRLAGESLAEKLTVLVAKCMPVIKIERPCALLSGIDAKFQRSDGGFIGALDERLERQDASASDIDWQSVEYRMDSGARREA